MLWIDSRSVDAQNRIIKELQDTVKDLESRNKSMMDRIEGMRAKAQFYLDMQYRIQDNPHVLKAFRSFMTMVRLTLDESVQGLTHENKTGRLA